MNKSKCLVIIGIIFLISTPVFAQEILPLSGNPSDPEWDGDEKQTAYDMKPFEITPPEPRPKPKEEIKEPIKPDKDKKVKTPGTKKIVNMEKYWIKGGFFNQEDIIEEHPGIYGLFAAGTAWASFNIADGGFMRYPDPIDPTKDLNIGFAKAYINVDIPVVDYFQLQFGGGGLGCFLYDVKKDSYYTSLQVIDSTDRYGWVVMVGASYLVEIHKLFALILWGQGFYGQAGLGTDSYSYIQGRVGARMFLQVSQEGYFTIYGGPVFNWVSIERDVTPAESYTKPPWGVEMGFTLLNALTIKWILGFSDIEEFKVSFGASF